MAARRLPIDNSATDTIRLENGLIIREDTSASGFIHAVRTNFISLVRIEKTTGANDSVTILGPNTLNVLENMTMADADALEFVTAVTTAAGFAANSPHSTLED